MTTNAETESTTFQLSGAWRRGAGAGGRCRRVYGHELHEGGPAGAGQAQRALSGRLSGGQSKRPRSPEVFTGVGGEPEEEVRNGALLDHHIRQGRGEVRLQRDLRAQGSLHGPRGVQYEPLEVDHASPLGWPAHHRLQLGSYLRGELDRLGRWAAGGRASGLVERQTQIGHYVPGDTRRGLRAERGFHVGMELCGVADIAEYEHHPGRTGARRDLHVELLHPVVGTAPGDPTAERSPARERGPHGAAEQPTLQLLAQ